MAIFFFNIFLWFFLKCYAVSKVVVPSLISYFSVWVYLCEDYLQIVCKEVRYMEFYLGLYKEKHKAIFSLFALEYDRYMTRIVASMEITFPQRLTTKHQIQPRSTLLTHTNTRLRVEIPFFWRFRINFLWILTTSVQTNIPMIIQSLAIFYHLISIILLTTQWISLYLKLKYQQICYIIYLFTIWWPALKLHNKFGWQNYFNSDLIPTWN